MTSCVHHWNITQNSFAAVKFPVLLFSPPLPLSGPRLSPFLLQSLLGVWPGWVQGSHTWDEETWFRG